MFRVIRRGAIYCAPTLLLGIFLLTLAAPLLATHDPLAVDLPHNLEKPSAEHLLGTDLLGRDIFSRLLYGGRRTLLMASGATLLSVLGGLWLGTLAYWGGKSAEDFIGSCIDALLALPNLLIALVVITLLDNSAPNLMLAVGIAGVGTYARTTRDSLYRLSAMLYVESALSLGAGRWHVIRYHLLPNAYPLLLTFAGVIFSWALLNGAALTFLGFVDNPDVPDWGVMLAAGRQTFAVAPWEALSAGVMLTITVGAVNRLAQGG